MHASSTLVCLISSIGFFLLPAYILNNFEISFYLRIIISLLTLGCFILWAPADTEKRPILQKKKRLRLKIVSIILCLTFIIASFYSFNNFISNSLLYILIIQSVVISPLLYKLWKHPYANYKNY